MKLIIITNYDCFYGTMLIVSPERKDYYTLEDYHGEYHTLTENHEWDTKIDDNNPILKIIEYAKRHQFHEIHKIYPDYTIIYVENESIEIKYEV